MNTQLRSSATRTVSPLALAAALGLMMCTQTSPAALAQNAPQAAQPAPPPMPDNGPLPDSQPLSGPLPDAWDADWDSGTYDRLHYVIGTVASFSPYRLLVARGSGETTQVDLKKGTLIRPVGLDLSPGEHIAVVGYWSKGTFIANRVVLRRA